ncbi:MAG: tRNA (5-methylaminomethyl-2-thiouridine)(34)-methyltransferase MnmD [bacterium]
MNSTNYQWLKTDDGSYTVYRKDLDEIYHSRAGALAECQHVYLKPFIELLKTKTQKTWRVLDVGFGLGLNWLSYAHYFLEKLPQTQLEIFSIENDMDILNLEQNTTQKQGVAQKLMTALKQFSIVEEKNIKARLIIENLDEALDEFAQRKMLFDVILYDPFAPKKNPECWTEIMFKKLATCAQPGALLSTYSVARPVCNALEQAGFVVEKRPGFGTKREHLVAFYQNNR